MDRRQALLSLFGGSLLTPPFLANLLAEDGSGTGPLQPKTPHFAGKAKSVILLYMSGGVSHIETFDPKPKLAADHGKPSGVKQLLGPHWGFRPGGECGAPVSDLLPHIRECMDDICLIRSMRADHISHMEATLGIHTGSFSVKRPSLGSWVSYGMGSWNQDLPSFVVLAPRLPYGGDQCWSADFLPAIHQGTRIVSSKEPLPNLTPLVPEELQQRELQLLARLNRKHRKSRAIDSRLAARTQSFETAFGMQHAMPDVLDLGQETAGTRQLYGLGEETTDAFGRQCLVARRMVERGVRFIELIDTGSDAPNNWDSHTNIPRDHPPRAKAVDQPIAALLQDLKQRGLLEETLVVWTTEFGRTPHNDGPIGRSHHPHAFSSWLAGAGVRPGMTYGATDEYGYQITENEVHVHDFHATILHLLGFAHEQLTYRHGGRDFRLTDVSGNVVHDILT